MMTTSIYKRYIPGLMPSDQAGEAGWLLIFNEGKLLVKHTADTLVMPEYKDLAGSALLNLSRQYIGEFDGKVCYCLDVTEMTTVPEGLEFKELRALLGQMEEDVFLLAGRAFQIINWNRLTRYCGKCGSLTENKINELAKQCSHCGSVFYPRISPAIIVAVTRGDRILLAHNKNFRPNWYSVIAGFVEPGETFEDCVRREVFEEVGIRVKNIQYFDSQPWPFPDSLMIGFTAEHASGEIQVDGEEIEAADWYSFDALPPCPTTTSIAGRLIEFVSECVEKNNKEGNGKIINFL